MTAVNLALNLLEEDGKTSLARKSDRHGQGESSPVDIVLPFDEANARLLVLVNDDPVNPSRPGSDIKNPYELKVEVLQDPDVNEPNDATATVIPLAPQNGGLAGTQTGWLSTTGDQDLFSFDVNAGKVLYLHITAPKVSPPPPYRLRYELLDPTGARISEGTAQNEHIAVDLATARRVKTSGTWQLKLMGFTGTGSTEPAPGNLDLKYTIDVRVFDEADPNELTSSNDTLETATPVSLGATGQTQSKTGRIGYVADPDWYAVTLPANTAPTVLHYRVRTSGSGGRFEPLSEIGDREVRVLRRVQTGGTAQQDVNACMTDENVCPKSVGNDGFLAGLITEQCQGFSPPRCLWARRVEHPKFENLRNFEGTLPIPPHSAAVTVYVLVQDEGNNWADDRDYTAEFSWRADADEASRLSGGVETPVAATLAEDTQGSYPNPPAGATALTGTLSYGPGFYRRHNPNNGDGVKGPADYDAVVSDMDQFEITLPMPDMPPLDLAWELQWQIDHLPDGGMPSDIAIELEFCDGSKADGGACKPVAKSSTGARLTIGYSNSKVNAWHNVGAPSEQRQSLYNQQVTASATTVTASPYGCFCFEPRFVQGGKFRMNVLAVDRDDYAPTPVHHPHRLDDVSAELHRGRWQRAVLPGPRCGRRVLVHPVR